ncbi:hypothetical protein Pth03_42590 [Planotetraspora thailandica]|uniref:Uncharacterized protein n=1 Tax=Planotetraspora thailandica TaxID=487172 RepID=A0A8J3V4C5_9ACTN|nr:hypothetical protein [Planotetraspora thailandica]GII55870.1 hypothetical protein Pth03_42590 [Planotetraspora thailandica]
MPRSTPTKPPSPPGPKAGENGDPPEPPAVPTAQFWPGDPLFCDRDITATRRSLLALDEQAATAAAHSDGHRGASGSRDDAKVSDSKTAPSVSPVAVHWGGASGPCNATSPS